MQQVLARRCRKGRGHVRTHLSPDLAVDVVERVDELVGEVSQVAVEIEGGIDGRREGYAVAGTIDRERSL